MVMTGVYYKCILKHDMCIINTALSLHILYTGKEVCDLIDTVSCESGEVTYKSPCEGQF